MATYGRGPSTVTCHLLVHHDSDRQLTRLDDYTDTPRLGRGPRLMMYLRHALVKRQTLLDLDNLLQVGRTGARAIQVRKT